MKLSPGYQIAKRTWFEETNLQKYQVAEGTTVKPSKPLKLSTMFGTTMGRPCKKDQVTEGQLNKDQDTKGQFTRKL